MTRALAAIHHRQGTVFAPSSVAGLKLWLKADGPLWQDAARTTPVAADGDPVGAWDDASSSGWTLTQSTSTKRPLYKTTGAPNGKAFVRFDGVDDYVVKSGIAPPVATVTLFLVVQYSGTTFGLSLNVGDVGGAINLYRNNADPGTLQLNRSGVGGVASTGTVGSGAFHVVAVDVTTSTVDFFIDGVAGGSPASAQTYSGSSIAVGAQPDGTGAAGGDVCEFLVYDSVLSASNRGAVTAYLGSKYGITVS